MQLCTNAPLNIALSANERYMPGALVAAASVAVYAKPETTLNFHLFTEGVRDSSFEFFVSTLERLHTKTKVFRHECDEKILNGLPYWAGSRMAAVRCNYATLMPKVDWCLYLDCDTLYLANIDEHFSYRDDSVYACVVQEESAETRNSERRWIKEVCGVDVLDEEYFNSGVVLFNLAKMRADGVPDRLVKFFLEHPNVPSPDQDALNTVFATQTKIIPAKFDRLQIYLTDSKLKEHPVIHYVTGNPWLSKYGEVASHRFRLWHMFADKYIWQKRGGSYRQLFSTRMLVVKYLSYYLLKMPVVWRCFVKILYRLKLIIHPVQWRELQVVFDVSSREVKKILESR